MVLRAMPTNSGSRHGRTVWGSPPPARCVVACCRPQSFLAPLVEAGEVLLGRPRWWRQERRGSRRRVMPARRARGECRQASTSESAEHTPAAATLATPCPCSSAEARGHGEQRCQHAACQTACILHEDACRVVGELIANEQWPDEPELEPFTSRSHRGERTRPATCKPLLLLPPSTCCVWPTEPSKMLAKLDSADSVAAVSSATSTGSPQHFALPQVVRCWNHN